MAPNMIDFTIQIDVRRDIWEDYKDAKYAPALIDLGAAVVPKFITGKWEDAAEKITITRQEPSKSRQFPVPMNRLIVNSCRPCSWKGHRAVLCS